MSLPNSRMSSRIAEICTRLMIRLVITASVGISAYPEDGNDPQSLLKAADIAMYRSQERISFRIRIVSVHDHLED